MSDEEHYEWDPGLLEKPQSRREFLGLGVKAAGIAALAGPLFGAFVEQADAAMKASVGVLDTTPLGKAQAAALKASRSGSSPTRIAVDAAKQFKGVTITNTYEAGLQALDPKNYSGPVWEQLTGVKLVAAELPHPDQYSKPIAEHIAGSGAYDVLDIEPAWVPSMAEGGVIAPIDDYIAKYRNQSAVADLHPLYRHLTTYKGKTWGFFDDGDQLCLYYRKDVFGDSKLKKAYQAKFKQPLRVPQSWDEYSQVAQFITDQMAPNVYGTACFRKFGNPGNQFAFLQEYRANGGVLFDANTMKAQLDSPVGVKTLQQMLSQNKSSPPGGTELDAVAQWTVWLQGKVAMMYSWPPTGRMSENYSQSAKAINFIPKSQIVGKVGYALMPGKHGEMASGYVKALASDSKNKDAAYLFMQWVNSPAVSLARVMLPYALRDPFRLAHYRSPLYRSLWPAAKEYLINLSNAANEGVLDMIMPGWQDYALSVDRMCTSVWAGKDPKSALATAASEWDSTTSKLGVAKQKDAYQQFLKLPGSSAKNTIAAIGQAVHIT